MVKVFSIFLALWLDEKIEEKHKLGNIVCKFNPGAPQFGGTWELLVRSCKKAMIAVLGYRSITDKILSTTIGQVKQNLNARPLTPLVSDDPKIFEELTRNHFLIGRTNISVTYIPNGERYSDLRKAEIKQKSSEKN